MTFNSFKIGKYFLSLLVVICLSLLVFFLVILYYAIKIFYKNIYFYLSFLFIVFILSVCVLHGMHVGVKEQLCGTGLYICILHICMDSQDQTQVTGL